MTQKLAVGAVLGRTNKKIRRVSYSKQKTPPNADISAFLGGVDGFR